MVFLFSGQILSKYLSGNNEERIIQREHPNSLLRDYIQCLGQEHNIKCFLTSLCLWMLASQYRQIRGKHAVPPLLFVCLSIPLSLCRWVCMSVAGPSMVEVDCWGHWCSHTFQNLSAKITVLTVGHLSRVFIISWYLDTK